MSSKPSKIKNPDFTKLIQHLEEGLKNLEDCGFPGKDFDHYTFETAMECLYGPDVWTWYNEKYDQ